MKLTKKFFACFTAVVLMMAMLAATAFAESIVDWDKDVIRATGISAGKPNSRKKIPASIVHRRKERRSWMLSAI